MFSAFEILSSLIINHKLNCHNTIDIEYINNVITLVYLMRFMAVSLSTSNSNNTFWNANISTVLSSI